MKIFQTPNPPLIIFLSAALVRTVIQEGIIHNIAYIAFIVAAIVWSYLEVSDGINWFRRLLGVIVLAIVCLSLYRELFF